MVRPFINRRHRRKDGGADDDLAKDHGGFHAPLLTAKTTGVQVDLPVTF
jgi:hypothetical protein